MMNRHFQRHHRAFAPGYALGLDLRAKGKPDPREPKVLGNGDPEIFLAMAKKWNRFTQSHLAGVLSFEEEISDATATRLAEEHIDVLLPGRRPGGQFLTLFVRHREKGRKKKHRTGIHYFVLHTDLWRDRKCDAYWPARDQRRMEAWQEFVNLREGYASPKDPHRSRSLQVRAWPESPVAAEMAEHYGHLLRRHAFDPSDREEIACTLALHGASDCSIDRTRTGRLRARFSAQAEDGRIVNLSAIASPRKKDSPLLKSALRSLIGPAGFRRTPEVFAALGDLLQREISHAAKRMESRHGISPEKLEETLYLVQSARYPIPAPLTVSAETMGGFPGLQPVAVLPPPDLPQATERVAALRQTAEERSAAFGRTVDRQDALKQLLETPDETGMGFPRFKMPEFLLDLKIPVGGAEQPSFG